MIELGLHVMGVSVNDLVSYGVIVDTSRNIHRHIVTFVDEDVDSTKNNLCLSRD